MTDRQGGGRAWWMFGVGLVVYIAAVMQRTTFGVVTVDAGQRFGVAASVLSMVVVIQLFTYAVLQLPVGVLTDRLGSHRVLALGAGLMAVGQFVLAQTDLVGLAILGRLLVGAGDAMTFGPLLRILPAWFPERRIPLLNQLLTMTGQVGQFLSAVPFVYLLHRYGWTPAFGIAAAAAAFAAVVALALVRDAPPGTAPTLVTASEPIVPAAARIVRLPRVQLGFWIHWISAPWSMLFAFMWGFPFLIQGNGLDVPTASALFGVLALSSLPVAPIVGVLSQRFAAHRVPLAWALNGLAVVPWLVVLAWPGPAPVWLLLVLVIGVGAVGPASSLGYDVARSGVPKQYLGTASGVVIGAGFASCLLNMWLVGLLLDLLGGYTLANFKVALATQFLFFGVGIVGMIRCRAKITHEDQW